jgi:tripartite-type tricarboxylate transporter receptor subunit TctC
MTDSTSPPIGRRAALGTLAAAGLAAPGILRAQGQYPTRPVTVVVGFPPGGQTDFAARILTPGLSSALGQPIVIDNKGGAGGNLGTDAVLRARRTATRCSPATPTRSPSTRTPSRA